MKENTADSLKLKKFKLKKSKKCNQKKIFMCCSINAMTTKIIF